MRNPDEIMAYEAKQQELVEGILHSLHDAADEDDDHIVTFQDLAKHLFADLCGGQIPYLTSQTAKMVVELINRPILDFIGRSKAEERFAEMRYLQYKVFEGVLDPLASCIVSDYHRLELGL